MYQNFWLARPLFFKGGVGRGGGNYDGGSSFGLLDRKWTDHAAENIWRSVNHQHVSAQREKINLHTFQELYSHW